jgi:FixJ family two-component response regulator
MSLPLPIPTSPAASATVYLLDDEPEMVKALTRLLRAKGFQVRGFTSVLAFLKAVSSEEVACLVLDVSMPELDGLELQRHLLRQGSLMPIIFLTAHGDIPMSVRAIKAGATDFLTKPVDAALLVPAVTAALQVAETRMREHVEAKALADRALTLTPREREVMRHVVAGELNKQIAAALGTGEQNIKQHRANIMKKMGVVSVADLVRAVERLLRISNDTSGEINPHSSQTPSTDHRPLITDH